MSHDDDLLVLNGKRYLKQARWSREKNINARTTALHRQQGLPWLDWGGEVYIPEIEGDAYIAARIKRRNPPRRRRQANAPAEMST
jgi:hypothetical protein